jgi:hypothetical protein
MQNVCQPRWRFVTRRLTAFVGLLLLLVLNSVGHALIRGPNPPSCQSHTLEALTIDADIIMTATVVSSYTDTRMREWHASFVPKAVLKSRTAYVPPANVIVDLDFFFTSYQYADGDEKRFYYSPPGARVLLFLRQDNYLLDCIPLDSTSPACSMLSPRVVDITLRQIMTSGRVLDVVEEELRRTPLTLPTKAFFTYPSGPQNLPNDDRLLPAARQWVQSEDIHARLLAVRVLETTADPRDLPILKSLLDDPGEMDFPLLSPWSGKAYPVRAGAWEALKEQGIHLSLPVVQSARPGIYRPRSWFWPAAFLLGPWLLYYLWRRIRRHPRIALLGFAVNGLTLCCFLYAGACVPLWLRSRHTADEIVWAHAGLVISIDSWQGNVVILVAKSWPASTGLVHAAITPDPAEASPVRRRDIFWTGTGNWGGPESTLWTSYVLQWPPIGYVFGGGTTQVDFPFPSRSRSIHPYSKAAIAGAAYLYLIFLFLAFPLVRLLLRTGHRIYRALQAARSARRGLCPTCSYDLRAHQRGDRCPECGSVIATIPSDQ